ncbi:MAG: type II secretion system major pseudopilin GspG [Myxococcota bacterium]|jgi:general secretion pathway protein G|nr:type II secretion system protein GspG [Deltaproteobacteria bacterium]MCP4239147.1 type II secretion system major pseudopilin GspG [bacterium]MDP6074656.1 type II secretion system major pseudopilin GspG [Myxococcota bacterium]MDP6241958.1 type II secretion system major pseudopilin GspG [Myxococcota bacterium]MDP7072992.1 type II secretion system major pseudopilin GspG [Myxococcota bacterium]
MQRNRIQSGFTLIEIMAVVIIIGLLTGVVGFQIFQQVDKGRATTARTQISTLEGVLELYRMDNGKFPTTEQGLEALVQEPTSDPIPRNYPAGGYLKGGKVPQDPWHNPYEYEAPGQHNSHAFDIWSLGSDNNPGGQGIDSDIGNWTESELN